MKHHIKLMGAPGNDMHTHSQANRRKVYVDTLSSSKFMHRPFFVVELHAQCQLCHFIYTLWATAWSQYPAASLDSSRLHVELGLNL